ncbi:hypothetical protein BDZ94DRAFT_1313329 [Collybia nuda]|uniref:Uncharacterized protein n=1 Tax=Collybia nuda TaxID=64659 RepID=A0A9P5XZ78_9AGAR|nr:hypothetical protein BDZ94DRAFT_1313329 [Collybia nuda]
MVPQLQIDRLYITESHAAVVALITYHLFSQFEMGYLSRLSLLLTASAFVSGTLANLEITNPNKDSWWVANSQNVLTWTCEDSPVDEFTVSIANEAVLPAELALVGIVKNFDCSRTIVAQPILSPALGYTIIFANPLNSSDVYAISEEFEIKPLGSSFPISASS